MDVNYFGLHVDTRGFRDFLRVHLACSSVVCQKELGTLPHLEKLLLSHNCLGNTCLEIGKWEWMEQTAISQSLKELDISNNNFTELPLQIGKLQSLICLNVSQNLLTKVPQIIGTLQHLAKLDLSTNLLLYLPGSMRGMELDYLDTTNNPFRNQLDEYRSPTLKVASLLDLAAKAVKKYRLPHSHLPSSFARYLENVKYCCICRNPCFHSDIKDFRPLLDAISFPRVCQSSTLTTDRAILFKCYFCSSKCYIYCET
ncbi:leucine-rich repeat protein SHOC-2-like [Pseudomyrmex gracilis]|uniref:leucine-rich repeat protein SHOC-2-like n=1 Tax=Pseudomyrmex gracilis TaxID=219809 RepID=UPI0009949AA0|nr:leucine-rich repeat protein SHOC-2-like [Pseudomyrmex gracilis]